ncbi:MAG: phosphotransferase family protein, partial [Ilumatobacteraceae bacterium]
MQHATTTLPDEVRSWIEDATSSTITSATRRAGGGRNEGWLIELISSGGDQRTAFLRWDRSDPSATGDPWTVRREATVYRALSTTDLPVAHFIAVHPTRQALLLEVVTGDGRFSAVTDRSQATAIAQDFMRCLARLHHLDVVRLRLADAGSTVADHVHAQLDEIDALIAFRGGVPAAELAIALGWLRANVPAYDGPPVLVQGDTGPGNFMFDGDRVTAIVDWELAHPGDPMDDLAWVSLRSVQEPFPDLEERFAEYEHASGHPIDVDRIRYYRVLAEAKIMAMGHGLGSDSRQVGSGDTGARLIFGQLHRRLLVETLSEVLGMPADQGWSPSTHAPEDEPEWHALYGSVLAQLRDVITPRIGDGFALQRTKGLARVIKYLESVDLNGRAYASQELDDLGAVLGSRPSSPSEGRRRLAVAVRER